MGLAQALRRELVPAETSLQGAADPSPQKKLVTQVVQRRIIGQPIVEIEANKEIKDTHMYLDNERIQIRKKKERPVMCKKSLQFLNSKK